MRRWVSGFFTVVCLVTLSLTLVSPFIMPAISGSASMEPTIKTGSMVFIHKGATPHVGDVAMYAAPGGTVTHRLVGTSHGSLIFQGDANNTVDHPVQPSAVVGVAYSLYVPYANIWLPVLRGLTAVGLGWFVYVFVRDYGGKTREV